MDFNQYFKLGIGNLEVINDFPLMIELIIYKSSN